MLNAPRLCFIPLNPNATSPSAKLVTYLSHRYPTQEHQPYHLEHRLFSDTSSQLPGSDTKQRAYTHILTISHIPASSFICTTKAGNPEEASSITIPSSSSESFAALVLAKLQPLWHVRQAITVESGTSVLLQSDEWRICIGDVRVAPRTPGAGTLRGMVIEVNRSLAKADDLAEATTEEEDQAMFQGVLREIFRGSGESLDEVKMLIRTTSSRVENVDDRRSASKPDWALAKLYMDVFRIQGSR